MLLSLHVKDFVIVEECLLDFAPGFTVFSGETGAGKSILIDALALALGEKADASLVRDGRPKADISATFHCPEVLQPWLVAHELQGDNDSTVLLRRTVDAQGKSKAFINGVSVTQAQLRECADFLVDIHGQHAHQSLLKSATQRVLLDTHAQLHTSLATVADAYRHWQAVSKQCSALEHNARAVELERERLQWQVEELTQLAPRVGEWAEINQEHQRLAYAASLIEGAQSGVNALSENDGAVLAVLTQVLHQLRPLADIDPSLNNVLQALNDAQAQVSDAVSTLNHYAARLELDPARLAEYETRLEAWHTLARKYRVAPELLPQEWQRSVDALRALGESSDLATLRKREAALENEYRQAAHALNAARQQACAHLSREVTRAMQDLSMAGGRFEARLIAREPAVHGLEDIEFWVAAHPGVALRPLAKVASGGELARISLAISVIASSATATPTLIFDEVDSGIGGAVAEVVGRLLKQLGQNRQVLCVTHLPQVAAKADQHFFVEKTSVGQRTVSQVYVLNGTHRIEEIARMLGGIDITAATRQAARELL